MRIDSQIISKLTSIGFKEYEAKIILVLMKGIPLSATEIAKEAKLIRNSIYDTLKSFAERGYCNEIETNKINKYVLIDPLIIMDKIEKEYNDQNKNRVNVLRESFAEINKEYKENKNKGASDDNSVELIRGFNKLRLTKYLDLIKNARKEILAMTSVKGLITGEIDEFTKEFIAKGGVVKSIYRINLDVKIQKKSGLVNAAIEDLLNICKEFEKSGEQIRLTEMEIPNMVIVDRAKFYVNITGDDKINKNKQADLIVNDFSLTKNMSDLFFHYWDSSSTLDNYKIENS
jgi:sugar-specific transcriptional regulator TrmB